MSSLTSALEIGLIGVVSAATALIATTPASNPNPVNSQGEEQVASEFKTPHPSSPITTSDQPQHQSQHDQERSATPEPNPTVLTSPPQSFETTPKPIEPIVEKKDPSSDFLLSLGNPIAPSPTASRITHSVTSPTDYVPIAIPQEPVNPENLVPSTLPDSSASSVLDDEADSQASIRSIPPTPGPDAFNSAPPTPFFANETHAPSTLERIPSNTSNMSAPPLETVPAETTPNHSYGAVTGQPSTAESVASFDPVEQREREQQESMDREQSHDESIPRHDEAIPPVLALMEQNEKHELRDESLYAAPAPQEGGLTRDVSMTRGFVPVPTSADFQTNNFAATPSHQESLHEGVSDSALNPQVTPYAAPVVQELAAHDGQQQQSEYQPTNNGMSFDEQRVPVEYQQPEHIAVLPVIQTDNLASSHANNFAAAPPSPVSPTNHYNQSVVSPSFSEARDSSTAGAHASPKDLAKISKSEHKRAKSISKILKQEGKDETKQLEMAIKELSRLQKNQRDSVSAESKAAKIQQEALKVERKAHERFLKEKSAYDKVLAHLHTRDEELKAHQDATLRQSQILGEQTAKVEQLRNAKAIDDRMRAEKLAELRK